MPSIRPITRKDGSRGYEIRVRTSRDTPERSKRWYPPAGWSQRAIDRELAKVSADFERRCYAGEIKTRAQIKEETAEAEREAAKIRTLRQYGEQVFMPSKTITVSEHTRAYYQNAIDRHINPRLGDYKLPEISSAQISALFLSLMNTQLSHSSIIGVYVTLNQLFRMAFLDDSVDRNPMDRVDRPKPRKDEKNAQEVEAFTADELKYILTCMEREPLKWQTMIRLMIDTGIRRGEACGLKWEAVDMKTNTATISTNLCYTKDAGIYLDTPKGGKTREVYFSDETKKLLHRLRMEQAQSCISQFVFTQDGTAEPMHPQSPTRYLTKFGKRYGIKIHPHKLRHSFASVAITNGADIASVSEVLGHSDKAVTLRMYTHANEESKRRAAGIVLAAIKEA